MKGLLAIALLFNLGVVSHNSRAETNHFYPVTLADKQFLAEIKLAVSSRDIEWLSQAVHYPLVLRCSDRKLTLRNAADFRKHSATILSPHLKAGVQSQSPDSLFKNWCGVMIGNGVIWFERLGDKTEEGEKWVHRIIGINPEDRSPPKAQEK